MPRQHWTEDEDTRLTAAVMREMSGEKMGFGGWGRVATALGGANGMRSQPKVG